MTKIGFGLKTILGTSQTDILQDVIRMHHDVIGKPEKGFITDHVNRDKLDSRKENLRHITQSQNIRNSSKSDEAKYIHKRRRRFVLKFRIDGLSIQKSFASYEEAEVALKFLKESLAES